MVYFTPALFFFLLLFILQAIDSIEWMFGHARPMLDLIFKGNFGLACVQITFAKPYLHIKPCYDFVPD